MDRKVLAIVGIIALHLALMLVFRGTLKPEELAQSTRSSNPDVSPIEPNPYRVPSVPVVTQPLPDDQMHAAQVVAKVVKKPHRGENLSRKHISLARIPDRDITSFKTMPSRTVAVTPPVWQGTIILLKRNEVQPLYQAQRAAAIEPKAAPTARITPIKKKKPFLKKAVTVIRKPYDWIKTLVSKL